VHIKCVIYVTMVSVVTVHYKGKEQSEVLSRSFVVRRRVFWTFSALSVYVEIYIFCVCSSIVAG